MIQQNNQNNNDEPEEISIEEEPIPEKYISGDKSQQNGMTKTNINNILKQQDEFEEPEPSTITAPIQIKSSNQNTFKKLRQPLEPQDDNTSKINEDFSNNSNNNNLNNINNNNLNTINNNSNNNNNLNNNINNSKCINNSISQCSRVKTNSSFYDNSKFENYNIEKMRYDFVKDYSYLHIDKDEDFLQRMQFDIYKRQFREERLNKLVEQNKIKIDEDEKIKAFNRLIEDANRRLEAQENLENMKDKLDQDITDGPHKKYNDKEWNDIYKKRFQNYVDNKNKRIEENIKNNLEEKKRKENELINMCPKKKASQKHIKETAQRLYDDAKKRKLKIDEKIYRINNDYNNKDNDDPSKYVKIIKSSKYNFSDDGDYNNVGEISKYYQGNKKHSMKKKPKGMAVSDFNNKRFEIGNQKNKKTSENNYNINVNHNNTNNKKNNNFNFDLDEERNELLQMANLKKLQEAPDINVNFQENNNIINDNNSNEDNNNITNNNQLYSPSHEVNEILEQFFRRQINGTNL